MKLNLHDRHSFSILSPFFLQILNLTKNSISLGTVRCVRRINLTVEDSRWNRTVLSNWNLTCNKIKRSSIEGRDSDRAGKCRGITKSNIPFDVFGPIPVGHYRDGSRARVLLFDEKSRQSTFRTHTCAVPKKFQIRDLLDPPLSRELSCNFSGKVGLELWN